jgi:hypothetical protein
MGGDEQAILILISQMRKYWLKKSPYDLPYDIIRDTPEIWWMTCPEKPGYLQQIGLKLLSIVSHSANCERIFSVLKWFYGQRRTKLSPNRISMMAKIYSYYVSNAKNHLQYYGSLLSSDEIQNQVIYAIQNLTDLQEIIDDDSFEAILLDDKDNIEPQLAKDLVNEEELKRVLEIEVCVDLSNQIFIENNVQIDSEIDNIFDNLDSSSGSSGNINFNVEDLINQVLDDEF